MQDLRFLLRVSRPRFWIYVLGPYLIGVAAAASGRSDFARLDTLIFGLYFLLPANLLIYGINDIFDYETDSLNPKKDKYEVLVKPESHRKLRLWIALLNVPFITAAILLIPQALPPLAGFLFFSIYYSATPVRAKAVPFLDSIFNILYVFPGAFAYQMLTGSFPPIVVILAAGLWTMAMHAYSAIADIDADKKAGMDTVATALGSTGTHMFCMACYLAAAVSAAAFAPALMLLGLVYLPLMLLSAGSKNRDGMFSIYRLFPMINSICGFLIFWYAAWPKFF
ncbi:MAG: prenyltransferase [Pyrinomonadaceae bacterium]